MVLSGYALMEHLSLPANHLTLSLLKRDTHQVPRFSMALPAIAAMVARNACPR